MPNSNGSHTSLKLRAIAGLQAFLLVGALFAPITSLAADPDPSDAPPPAAEQPVDVAPSPSESPALIDAPSTVITSSGPCVFVGTENVQSDQGHYALGETAHISGTGFAASCDVVVQVTRPNLSVVTGDGQNTAGSDALVTDAAGSFAYDYIVTDMAGRWYNVDVLGEGGNLGGSLFSAGPIVSTDQGDYLPGDVVTISGEGFQAGEVVRLDVHQNDGDLTFFAVAAVDGAFVNTDFVPAAEHLGVLFTLTATGLSSGLVANNNFMDGPAFVQVINTNTKAQVANSSITVTVPATGVAAGNSIIVTLNVGSFAGAIGCSDATNGTYITDISSPAGSGRIAVVSKHNVAALASGAIITCTYPGFSGGSTVSAYEFSGLSAADQTAQGGSSNAGSATSGLTPTTTQPNELIFGFFNTGNAAPIQTVTPAVSGSSPAEVPYAPPYTQLASAPAQFPMYRIVTNGPRQYAANGTVAGSGGWKAQLVTYKAATATTGSMTVVKNTTGGDGTFNFTVSGTSASTPSITTTTGTGTTGPITVTSGSYSVTETAQAGWTAGSATCTSGTPASFTVPVGGNVTCTFNNTKDAAPTATLHVIKHVINNSGGSASAANWTLAVSSSNGGTGTGSAPGIESPGTTYTLQVGKQYSVAESGGPSGYGAASAGDCSIDSAASGADYTCTITNDDQQGTLTVVKNLITDSGTLLACTDFVFQVDGGSDIPFELDCSNDVLVDAGDHTVTETAVTGFTTTYERGESETPDCIDIPVAIGGVASCIVTNDDQPGTLVVTKHVITDNGGEAVAGDFSLTVTATNVAPSATFNGSETGTTVTLNAGAYSVDEDAEFGYLKTLGTDCSGSIGNGETKYCTITNDDIQPKLYVIKHVITDNGGDADASDFDLSVTGVLASPSSFSGEEAPGTLVALNAGDYSVDETEVFGYARSDSADCSGTIAVGETKTCTVTNDDIQPKLTVTKILSPETDPGRFNLLVNGVVKAANISNNGTTGELGINASTVTVSETAVAPALLVNYTRVIGGDCAAAGTITLVVGQVAYCTITNTVIDTDGDDIPDFLDCSSLYDNRVVDPAGTLSAYLPAARRHATLQAAVIASVDNDNVMMYANTSENVIIGTTTSSGGKDLRVVGCGHKIRGAVATSPVVTVQVSAGANDGNTGSGEMDIHIEDLSVLKGSIGISIQTSKASTNNTSTLLKSIRSDQNGPSNGTGTATVANPGIGIKVEGNGNEVRGANSVGTNAGDGIQVVGNNNVLLTNRITVNKGDGIDVAGSYNTIEANKVGDKSLGNKGNGILVGGANNTVNENDVFANTLVGINISGNMNNVFKNSVGEDGKGNLGGGILITGNNNVLGKAASENNVFENTGVGIAIVGNTNSLVKNKVGDKDKGNTGDGINVRGTGNVIDQNDVFANGGDGIDSAGGTAASPNLITNNTVGDRGKGNLGDGIVVGAAADLGNGILAPIEISGNTVRANKLIGIDIKTAGHQLSNDVSGGTGSYASGGQDNGKAEFLVATGNFNAGGNTANGAPIAGALNSAFPTAGQGTV